MIKNNMEKIKKYLVFDENNIHDYTLVVKTKDDESVEYILSTNDNECWVNRYKNKEVIKIIDNGNLEVKITLEGEAMTETINIAHFESLRMVMNFINKTHEKPIGYKIIEESNKNFINI